MVTWKLAAQSDDMLHLDVLRFLASLAIICFHFQNQLQLPAFATPFLKSLGRLNIAVDLFFFISGFVISRFYSSVDSLRTYTAFIWKRFARLYPLHLATALAFVMIGIGVHQAHWTVRLPEQFDFSCLPANLLLIHSLNACPHLTFNQVSWSISAEMLLYLCLPAILLIRRLRWAAPLLAVVGFVLLYLKAPDYSPLPWYDWTFDFGFLRALPSFLFGCACFDYRRMIARIPRPEALMWGVLILATLLLFMNVAGTILILLLFSAAICGIAADGTARQSSLVRVLAPYGTLTYSLYLIHPLVDLVFISFFGKKFLHLNGARLDLLVAIAVPVVFLFAYFSYTLFENPARRWVTGLYLRGGARRMPAADAHTPL
jgi:peptidoglycan/LPS O-acetylase OafA/YrhL